MNYGRARKAAGEVGTCVVVRNLFKELPVRLAEAKKRKIPMSKVKSLIMNYAFVRGVRFVLQYRGNKRVDWSFTGGNPVDAAVSVFGRDIVRGFKQVTWENEEIRIEGIVPRLNEGTAQMKVGEKESEAIVRDMIDGRYDDGEVLTDSLLLCRQSTHLTPT